VGAAVTDAMGRLAPEGLIGIHTNLFVPALGGVMPTDTEQEKRGGRADRRVQGDRLRLLRRAGHAAADDRLRAARIHRRAGGLDARPRHRIAMRRSPAHSSDRQPSGNLTRDHILRQHHAVLADRHRSLGGAVVLGERTGDGKGSGRRPGAAASHDSVRVHNLPRRDLADPAQLGREGIPECRLLQRGRQRWPLRGMGGARAVLAGDTGGVLIAAVARRSLYSSRMM
jgi:hypothetical protein